MYQFQNSIQGIWISWKGLFEFLPYGDPYIATVALFVIVAVSAKFMAGGEAS